MTIVEWLSSAPLLLGVAAAVVAGAGASGEIASDSPWRRTSWRTPLLVCVAAIWGSFFFTHWASGFTFRPGPPARVINVMLLFTMFAGAAAAFMFGLQQLERLRGVVADLTPVRHWYMVALVVMLFGGGNIREAYIDLVTGRAAAYDRELDTRHALLRTSSHGGQAVTVAGLTRIPRSILFKDITDDPQHPHNGCYARFWDVPQVKTQGAPAVGGE